MCVLSSHPSSYVLIKQTKSELIATHCFLHKISGDFNGICLKVQGILDLNVFINTL